MLGWLLWYIVFLFLGLVAFPITFYLLPGLSDRGYTLSRTVGLLVWGYLFWILTSLGVLQNDLGGLIFTLALVVGLSLWAYRKIGRTELRVWWQTKRRLVIAVEILFLAAFAALAVIRSTNPEITGTEKPMELAFINAILHSPTFPPHDPWLSGYAISYYYFGYVLVAMLAKLTGVPGSVAFNLGISAVFALSCLGAFGILFNLLERFHLKRAGNSHTYPNILASLLAPLFLFVSSNVEGFLEMLHARGILWTRIADGAMSSRFWTWLDIKDLNLPPTGPLGWIPTRFYWWWRASRVLQDYDLANNWKEIIDEFPFFSFLLADLHPHVLAIPFAMLVVAMSLNIFLGGSHGEFGWSRLRIKMRPVYFLAIALILGGLAFLNTWDFPIYLILVCAAQGLYRLMGEGLQEDQKDFLEIDSSTSKAQKITLAGLIKELLILAIALGVSGIILYLPFYLGFSSQAGGILPNLINPTRGAHLWVMFGIFLVFILCYLIYLWIGRKRKVSLLRALGYGLMVIFILWVVSLLFGILITSLPILGQLYVNSLGGTGSLSQLLQVTFQRRFTSLGWVTLLILLGLVIELIWSFIKKQTTTEVSEGESTSSKSESSYELEDISHQDKSIHLFVLLLILLGAGLVVFPEYFFLRDQFGWRMNTIFKFYYQAWLLWGLAAAFGTIVLLRTLRRMWGVIFSIATVLLIGISLVYPVFGLWTKTSGFKPAGGYSLDGTRYMETASPDDYAAINWLKSAPPGVVLEAVGGSYSEYARVSALSGLPTVLGWPGHESQWRGGYEEMGTRQTDIAQIYKSSNWDTTRELLDRYDIRYIFIGPLERNTYAVNEAKFLRYLKPVFQQGSVVIYEYPQDQAY
jgi:YYY domain-containing protein